MAKAVRDLRKGDEFIIAGTRMRMKRKPFVNASTGLVTVVYTDRYDREREFTCSVERTVELAVPIAILRNKA